MRSTGQGLGVEATIVDSRIRNTFVNPFRHDLCTCGTDNDTFYVRVRLPKAIGVLQGVKGVALSKCLESAKRGSVQCREEEWRGERFLHVQIDFKHDTLAGISSKAVVQFVVETKADQQSN